MCCTISASGALRTCAIDAAALGRRGARTAAGAPTTVMPRRASAAANSRGRLRRPGSGCGRRARLRSRPSSTHSGLIGLTTSSGMYDGSQCGFTAGPVNSEAS